MPDELDPRILRLKSRPMGTGLGSIRTLLAALGDPQEAVPSVLVAGTNGKGSTCAMLQAILLAAGYRTGFFHSPSLGSEREQFVVDGKPVGAGIYEHHLRKVLDAAERVDDGGLTFFEVTTGIAFSIFAELRPDIVILEAGLGGARDCTNIVSMPRASALVSVGLDHTAHLGDTPDAIAEEKAGVFRPGRPAIIGLLDAAAEKAAVRVAERIGAIAYLARTRILHSSHRPLGLERQEIECRTEHGSYRTTLGLAGSHQAANAGVAILLAEALAQDGFDLATPAAIERGLESCRWPGRLEWLRGPFGKTGTERSLLLDGAHNPDSAAALVDYLEENELRVDLLFGAFRDKDSHEILRILAPRIDRAWLSRTQNPRSRPADQLAPLAKVFQPGRVGVVPDLESALREALEASERPLLITGSIDLVARCRTLLLE